MNKHLWHARRYLLEIKIGTFFLVGVLLFFIAIVSLREANFLKGKYLIKVKFNYVEGLRATSPVRFCGVDAGEVDKVEIVAKGDERPYVYVYAKVDKEIKIPDNAFIFINSLSLFGEKYLEITPSDDASGKFLRNGSEVEGLSPTPLFATFTAFDRTMKEVENFIKEGTLKSSLEDTLLNLKDATGEINMILQDVRSAKGTVGKLFYDQSLYQDINEFVVDIKAHPWKLLYKPKGK
jgi:phospholipid/cholesterol/gamma-HCH transport system substrate-binding protein